MIQRENVELKDDEEPIPFLRKNSLIIIFNQSSNTQRQTDKY